MEKTIGKGMVESLNVFGALYVATHYGLWHGFGTFIALTVFCGFVAASFGKD